MQQAGLAEPPEGTIFVELIDDAPGEAVPEACEYRWPDDLRPIPDFPTPTSPVVLPQIFGLQYSWKRPNFSATFTF